jgi:glycogen operon protein
MTDLDRLDAFATDQIAGYGVRPGRALPFGATAVSGGVNFSLFTGRGQSVSLVLYRHGTNEPVAELPIPEEFRVGGVWAMTVFGLDYDSVEYGFRVSGPDPAGPGDRFDDTLVLADPYAKAMSGRDVWGSTPDWDRPYQYRSRLIYDDFDWDGDRPLRLRSEDLVIYEAHVRGFTADPSSGVSHPGTYAGLLEKIPYLRELGVNAIELMPVFEFDEFENHRITETGETLLNYWGYSTVGFFAPKAGYAATGPLGMQCDEFRNLIKELHRAGIEVILDVVFNHTAEGNERGPTISFRGLDNSTFYMLTPEGYYYNFSGTGNTLNCNNPVVRDMVLNALRYWAGEFHIDGFRFDLAAVLGRGPDGAPMANPPLLEALAHDPLLRDCLLVAEAWDAGGLYQVGSFPHYFRWSEWNGKYRDTVRGFLKGDLGTAGELATRLVGSPDLYRQRGAHSSINFIACHDGFTLADLFAYNYKHNDANGEQNRDGSNDNVSWNSGVEGETTDPEVLTLRRRQQRNALTLLLLSQGIPMFVAGDELGRSQQGNNNGYCHDSPLSWLDWSLQDTHADLLRFTRNLIAFRAAHPLLRSRHHPGSDPGADPAVPTVSWHGVRAGQPDWSPGSRLIACVRSAIDADGRTDLIYLAANAHWESHQLELPPLPPGYGWHRFADTYRPAPDEISAPGGEPLLADQQSISIGPRSTLVLVGRPVE